MDKRIFDKYAERLKEPQFAEMVECFRASLTLKAVYSRTVKMCLFSYGDHGPDISGIVKEHFPKWAKDLLRGLLRKSYEFQGAGERSRPAGTRSATVTAIYNVLRIQMESQLNGEYL